MPEAPSLEKLASLRAGPGSCDEPEAHPPLGPAREAPLCNSIAVSNRGGSDFLKLYSRQGIFKQKRFRSFRVPSQFPAPGREVNRHSHRMFCSLHLAMSINGSNHEQRIINVSYFMDSAIASASDRDRHSASAERVDSSSVFYANVR